MRFVHVLFALSLPLAFAACGDKDEKVEEKSGGLEIKGEGGSIKIGDKGIQVEGKDGKVQIGGPGGIKIDGEDGKVEIKAEGGKVTIEATDKKAAEDDKK